MGVNASLNWGDCGYLALFCPSSLLVSESLK